MKFYSGKYGKETLESNALVTGLLIPGGLDSMKYFGKNLLFNANLESALEENKL